MDEKAELQALVSEYRRLAKVLEPFTKVKPGQAENFDIIQSALATLPSGDTMGRAVDELRQKTQDFLRQGRRQRESDFRQIEAEFVKAKRAGGKRDRELNHGWRIELLEFELNREQAKTRLLYNSEVLINWSPVARASDLVELEARAMKLLERHALPEGLLIEIFWDAYQQGRALRQDRQERVALTDLYREVRIALVRHELTGKKPESKLANTEFPRWAFLYNIDRYQSIASRVPDAKRLGFQTGSQSESRTVGMVINGLDTLQDYKVVCYAVPATPFRS